LPDNNTSDDDFEIASVNFDEETRFIESEGIIVEPTVTQAVPGA